MMNTEIRSLNSLQANQTTAGLINGFRHIAELPANALKVAYQWQTRASQRHQLSQLADHQLVDMGITRAAASEEISKPFWQS